MSMFPPRVAFDVIGRDELNEHLKLWEHKMGPLDRPQFKRGCAHGLRHDGDLVAVVATEQMIAPETCGLTRAQAFELARVCAARPGLCRVVVRLWREFVFPDIARAWECKWAISYQDALLHDGNLYRFDGWVRLGYTRSGTDSRCPQGPRRGRNKVVWGWSADAAAMAEKREAAKRLKFPPSFQIAA